jgi:hypothetical protein
MAVGKTYSSTQNIQQLAKYIAVGKIYNSWQNI